VSTCLVTGGAGFLGSHLCDELLARGNRVICADNFETGSLANIEHIRDPARFMHVGVDIIEPYVIEESVDFVYHLASPASPIDYLRLPLHTLKVGSYGTHHTLGLAKAKRARFLLASTSEEHWFPGRKIRTAATHGTGCTFSSALLAQLVSGSPPAEAVAGAKKYVRAAMAAAYPVGKGRGPLNHLYRLDEL